MLRTVKAVIERDGAVRLLECVRVDRRRMALVTILDDEAAESRQPACEVALLSEQALARDWERPEEDEAWMHLQPGTSSSGRFRFPT